MCADAHVCASVRACVRAWVLACVRACVHFRACLSWRVCACVCVSVCPSVYPLACLPEDAGPSARACGHAGVRAGRPGGSQTDRPTVCPLGQPPARAPACQPARQPAPERPWLSCQSSIPGYLASLVCGHPVPKRPRTRGCAPVGPSCVHPCACPRAPASARPPARRHVRTCAW